MKDSFNLRKCRMSRFELIAVKAAIQEEVHAGAACKRSMIPHGRFSPLHAPTSGYPSSFTKRANVRGNSGQGLRGRGVIPRFPFLEPYVFLLDLLMLAAEETSDFGAVNCAPEALRMQTDAKTCGAWKLRRRLSQKLSG